VLWLHGTDDVVYSVSNAEQEVRMFVNSKDAQLRVVEGGAHFLSASRPKEVDHALIDFVEKWANKRV
jgi:pimeloyl-ACP methyl ester carboxylesterase